MVPSSHSPCLLTSLQGGFLSLLDEHLGFKDAFGYFLFPAAAASAWMLQILGAFKVGLCQQGCPLRILKSMNGLYQKMNMKQYSSFQIINIR